MPQSLTAQLHAILEQLMHIYHPFAHPGDDWRLGQEQLDQLVQIRDQALLDAAEILPLYHSLWDEWEHSSPNEQERALIFATRSELVALAMEAARSDSDMERTLAESIRDTKRKAAESDRRLRAARAYQGARLN
jgi:Zn-dependent M32 family carboxypeptidase